MRRKFLAGFLSLCLALSLLPMSALAVGEEETVPAVTSWSIQDSSGATYTSGTNGPALSLSIPRDKELNYGSVALVTSEQVAFATQTVDTNAKNVIYVSEGGSSSATLTARLEAGSATYTIPMSLSSTNGQAWSGTGSVSEIPSGLTIGSLANELGSTAISVLAGGITNSAGGSNAAAEMRVNQDAENVYLLLYPAGLQTYTVTYDCDGVTYSFVVPSGSTLVNAVPAEKTGRTFIGWYTDANYSTPANLDQTVSGNITLYAKYTDPVGNASFDDALESNASTLPIKDAADFASFVAKASQVSSSQCVVLEEDIDLNNATYTAITNFKGNFNGGNHTLSNVNFTASGDNAGMFATLGAGQVVANLKLSGVTVDASNTTYAGVLVGQASGTESNGSGLVTIQNVQVSSSTVRGRSAGGITGFMIWTNVKYCSVTGGTVYGLVNSGGIAGISYSQITDCYTNLTPTGLALISKKGGIVGKNLDNAAGITHCWCTYSALYGQTDVQTGIVESLPGVGRSTTVANFQALNFDEDIWNLKSGTSTTFQAGNVDYTFPGGEES